MKKIISIIIAALMLAAVAYVPGAMGSVKAAETKQNAVFICRKWQFNGQYNGQRNDSYALASNSPVLSFGRTDHEMPSQCVMWTTVFLDVDPNAGESSEGNMWYVAMDTNGYLWFDPDGRFNDCRYYKYADPASPDYGTDLSSTDDSCTANPNAMYDPNPANNTQGPYLLPMANISTSYLETQQRNPLYFTYYDKIKDVKRTFRIGWVDYINQGVNTRVSYYNPSNNYITFTNINDWDVGQTLEPFLDGYNNAALPAVADPPTYTIANYFYSTGNTLGWDYGEEWHAINASGTRYASNNRYNYIWGDNIYRRGANSNGNRVTGYNPAVVAQARYPHYYGATRLVTTSIVSPTGRVIRYAAGSAVLDNNGNGVLEAGDDYDVGAAVYRFPLNTARFSAAGYVNGNFGLAYGTTYDTVHMRSPFGRNNLFDYNNQYTINGNVSISEPIYTKTGTADTRVSLNDTRMTTWGSLYSDFYSLSGPAGSCQPRDYLILSEVLKGGCASPTYNISVETDIWENNSTAIDPLTEPWSGEMPGKTYAAIRSPNGEFTPAAADVQKATVLDPDGVQFNVPACTFQNINAKYREYIGIEIWHDNGVDNNLGTDPTGVHQVIPNNASDDYYPDITGELFVGAQSNEQDADIGLGYDGLFVVPTNQIVLPMSDFFQQDKVLNANGFGAPVRFYDTTNVGGYGIQNIYGCGKSLYRDTDYLLPATAQGLGAWEISQGDIRMTTTTVVRTDLATGTQTVTTFIAGSTVAAGDADVNRNIGLGPVDAYNNNIAAGNDLSGFYDKYFDQANYTARVAAWSIPSEPVWLDWKHIDPADTTKIIDLNFRFDQGEFIYDAGANIVSMLPMFGSVGQSNANPYGTVGQGFTRLTNVEYKGNYYMCGSQCSTYDNWASVLPVNGITYGLNGVKRYMDMEVIPGSTGGTMKLSREFQVELTTEVEIAFDPPPQPGYWSNGQWIPDEVCYVLFQGIGQYVVNGTPNNLNNMLFECSPTRPVVKFEFTPYRGSCNKDGQYDVALVDNRGITDRSQSGIAWTYAFRESGGQIPAPPDGYYGDPTLDWQGSAPAGAMNPYTGKKFLQRVAGDFVPWKANDSGKPNGQIPYPPLPAYLENNYDCLTMWKHIIKPEQLDAKANRLCITTLDQKFPNLMVKLFDHDNSNDINDPADIPFSIPFDYNGTAYVPGSASSWHANVVNYNCYGGGVAWMAVGMPSDTGASYKYIIQYNLDGTYYYWYWYEPRYSPEDPTNPQIPWALDPTDVILGQTYNMNFPIPGTENIKRTPVFVDSKATLDDTDCSQSSGNPICEPCEIPGLRRLGDVSGVPGYPLRSDKLGIFDGTLGYIAMYGVPTYVSAYGQLTPTDQGGDALIVVKPRDGQTHLQIRIYSTDVIFDYNSTIAHPDTSNGAPFFVADKMVSGLPHKGIDYCATLDLKVYPPDPYVNFVEFAIVDHALQFSKLHYTAGQTSTNYIGSFSPLKPPTPQIQAPYDPLLRYVSSEFRCYPGGQTHTGRVTGQTWGDWGGPFGWNAYPAIWSKRENEKLGYEHFGKLGTEFFPLTDYGMYFIMKDGEGRHITFNPDASEPDRRVVKMEITGPFARPKVLNHVTKSVVTQYEYNGMKQVPIQYDWSGKIVIDETNWREYEMVTVRQDFNGSTTATPFTPYGKIPTENLVYRQPNTYVKRIGSLNYASVGWRTPTGPLSYEDTDNVIVLDEFIPWQPGKILIYVTLADGTFKMYQDCCTAPPVDGVDVHALGIDYTISEDPTVKHIPLGVSNKVEVKLSEKEPYFNADPVSATTECNDAVVYMWQDRGVHHLGADLGFGAGDGWVTNPPGSSRFYYGRGDGNAGQYDTTWDNNPIDINGDGKVAYADWETEIMGTYDMATNTWKSGIIDARTFQRNNGVYVFENIYTETSGIDFGGENGIGDKPDHIISDKEQLPVYVTAYKYGDDNNDRSFGPFWDPSPLQSSFSWQNPDDNRMRYSHEVYMAGQIAIPVEPEDDLIVTLSTPKLLTAGITPELISNDTPFTIEIKDKDGKPVNLMEDMTIPDVYGDKTVLEKNVWNFLFKDPHPDNTYYFGNQATLPQYYFVRTDLHNRDEEVVNNEELYSIRSLDIKDCIESISLPFRPIEINFGSATSGRYVFKGVTCNDATSWKGEPGDPAEEAWTKAHQFIVYVYSADRKHRGQVVVNVESPHVSYEMINVEDESQIAYTSPGDPDFVMTAADNRVYRVQVTITDAEGRLVKGVTKGVSVCGGGVKNTSRFTPFVTRPTSFDFDFNPCQTTPCTTKVYPHVGFDFDASEKVNGFANAIDKDNRELYQFGGFVMASDLTYQKCRSRVVSGYVEYNSTCFWYNDKNEWEVDYVNPKDPTMKGWAINMTLPPNLEFLSGNSTEPLVRGWGLGNIYNNSYWGGALFADLDVNKKLDYHDTLGLDVNAQTSFYVWAEDACFLGGLVGDNAYVNNLNQADVAGYPPRYRTDPRYMERRFKYTVSNDQVFYLDWEAWPDKVARISPPKVQLLDASSPDRVEIGKTFLNAESYDLVYNYDNQLIAVVTPADDRDIKMNEGGLVLLKGNQHEHSVYGRLKASEYAEKGVETTIEFTPTGTGMSTLSLYYLAKNKWFCLNPIECKYNVSMTTPEYFGVKVYDLDVGKGLSIEVKSLEPLAPKASTKLTITVKEFGTGAPVAGAKVVVSGLGVEQTKSTSAKGEVEIEVAPASTGFLKIEASSPDFAPTSTKILVGSDESAPMLEVTPPPALTNQSTITVTGKTESGATVTINGVAATTKGDGSFSGSVKLVEGKNVITVIATDGSGNQTKKNVWTTLDTQPPAIMVDKIDTLIDATEITISGRVDPGSKVSVKDAAGTAVEAKVVHDIWEATIKLAPAPSKNIFTVEAIDLAGNKNPGVQVEITNVRRVVLSMTKDQAGIVVDGTPQLLPGKVVVTANIFMAPYNFVEFLGGSGQTNVSGKGGTVQVSINGKTIVMTIGSVDATLNGTAFKLVAAPVISGSTVLIPVVDIAGKLGCYSDASVADKLVISYDKLP